MNRKYRQIEFLIDQSPFSIIGDLSHDFISGIVVVIFILDIKSKINSIYIDDEEIDPADFMSIFLEDQIIDEISDIRKINNYYRLEKEYGIWVHIQIPTLINYDDPDFLMTMIMMFDYFDQDFRNYIYGKPFNYDQSRNVIEYNIQDYDLKSMYDFDHESDLKLSLNLLPEGDIDLNFIKTVFENSLGNDPNEPSDPTYISYGQTYG